MTPVYALGLESQTVVAGEEFDTLSGTGITAVASPIHGDGNGGQQSARILRSGAAGISYIQHQFGATGNTDRIWIHAFAFRVVTTFSATNILYQITGAVLPHTSIRLTSGLVLQAFKEDTGTQIGSDGPTLQTGKWYWVCLTYDPSNGAVVVYLNLQRVISGTGLVTQSNRFFRIGLVSSVTGEVVVDDIVIGHGLTNAQPPLPTFLVANRPNADGDQNDSSGSFADLDETTPDEATTLAVLDVDGDIIDVNTLSFPAIPGFGHYKIAFITVNIRERSQSVAAESWVLRIKGSSLGTVSESGTYTHNDTAFVTNGDNVPRIPFVSETNPDTGKPWLFPALTNMQIGVRAVDAAPDIEITQLWAYIAVQPYPRVLAAQGAGW